VEDKLILLKRKSIDGSLIDIYEIHRYEINQTNNLIFTTRDFSLASNIVEGYNRQVGMFTKNDWNHLHDCILEATWNTNKKKCNQTELEEIFRRLPEDMKNQAYEWGMSDTMWRDDFIRYYTRERCID